MTLEDETGLANLVVHPATYRRYRAAARDAAAMLVRGHVERRGTIVHVVAEKIEDLSNRLAELTVRSRDFR